ncbi:heterokaryon incompatibility protein-domain-containing protein [Leptodontidium sp. MPI-SDFR-AT-0119]|nr:heterokaryon incompatibility protein-domain-containing protein [Leptodontidium sp. MPI-SDFR-AT-0119]
MSSYEYSLLPLEDDNIRLLHLLPNKDKDAPLQCELRNYSLQKLGPGTHLYEALSYVWGKPDNPLPICVDKIKFSVGANLHAALSRLRDHSFVRIIWVDSICINQRSPVEQGQQVQIMAKIYSNAHRVIVWLGDETEEIKGALEDIRLAADEESTEDSKKKMNKQAILKLLEQQWFQRIWVLQEVAAARHVVMMSSPNLQTIPSVVYLIERAGLRSKHTSNLPERFSLNIRCLVELIDMFHTRKATDVRDKVYALLGMSSDDPGGVGLRPDYEVSWKDLFRKLINFVLGKDVSVEIPDDSDDDSQREPIKSKGYILGQVSSVRSDGRQDVNITFTSKHAAWCLGDEIEWTLRASAKSIQERDIVCHLQGASKPTIIRLYKDYFAIIVIAVTPLKESRSPKQLELSKSIKHFPRDFLLDWDLGQPREESQGREESKNWMSFDQATRTWNVALILGDLEEYEKAEKRLREAIKGYEIAFGEEQSMLKSQYGLTPLSWAAGNGYNDVVNLLLAKDGIDPDLKDNQYSRTPLSWAARIGYEAIIKLLLETSKVEVDSKDNFSRTPLSWAAKTGREAIIKLLHEHVN